jgi:Golgi apparatus protein 1
MRRRALGVRWSRWTFLSLSLSFSALAAVRANDVCDQDVERYCKDVTPGQGRVRDCLTRNEALLSSACAAQWTPLKEEWSQVPAPCGPDANMLCGDILPGRGGIFACLRDHILELPEACQDALSPNRSLQGGSSDTHALEEPCIGDIRDFCQNVPSGEGRLVRCLEDHRAQISQRCRDVLWRRK